MKYKCKEYPLLGLEHDGDESLMETHRLAEEFIKIIIANKKSYAEACEALGIAKIGLKTLKVTY